MEEPIIIEELGRYDGAEAPCLAESRGKGISSVDISDCDLVIGLSDGRRLRLVDDGQQCCERRYMSTDDTLSDVVGATLLGIEVSGITDVIDDDYIDHNQRFLRVKTSKGILTIVNHNEHNGDYGGINVVAHFMGEGS